MIVKITRGARMLGAVEYLEANKEGVVRDDPRVVAGLDREGERLTAESMQAIAGELDAPHAIFDTEIKDGHVMAVALVAEKGDRPLDDAEWGAIGCGWMEKMGYADNHRHVVVRHGVNSVGADHVHVLVNMVGDDGRPANESWSLKRASRAAGELEREHGLKVNEGRAVGIGSRGYHPAEVAIAERLHGKGTEPAPDYIRRVVRAAAVEAPGRENFVRYLRKNNVTAHPGNHGGFSYSVPGSRQYQGSKLARDLSWPRIQEAWQAGEDTAERATHAASGRLAAKSLRTERKPGRLAAESRDLGRYAQTRASSRGLVLSAAVASALRERVRAANREAELERQLEEERARPRAPARDRGIDIGF